MKEDFHTFIVTRFSIFDPRVKSTRLSRLPVDEYKNILFSDDRLSAKFETFEKITVLSILAQTNPNFTFLIYAGVALPDRRKQLLENIVEQCTQAKLKYVESFRQMRCDYTQKISTYAGPYFCARLDDDDGLSPYFVELLQLYKNTNADVITFSQGQLIGIENGKFKHGKQISKPFTSAGLTSINKPIYSLGHHRRVKNKFNCIIDDTPEMFFQFCGKYCDTNREFVEGYE